MVRIGIADAAGGATPAPELNSFPGPIVIAARRGAVRVQGRRSVVHLDAERASAEPESSA